MTGSTFQIAAGLVIFFFNLSEIFHCYPVELTHKGRKICCDFKILLVPIVEQEYRGQFCDCLQTKVIKKGYFTELLELIPLLISSAKQAAIVTIRNTLRKSEISNGEAPSICASILDPRMLPT